MATMTITANVVKPKKQKYNAKELRKGEKVEREHTTTKKLQTVIAKNHLDEDDNYYKKLATIEKQKRGK